MEFVEGETLENLIKRSSLLEVTDAENSFAGSCRFGCGPQAEAGPSGHQTKQHHGESGGGRRCNCKNHRSWLKPRFQTPGAFAGTPEFASPEQFTGLGVGILSDLYSLGVTLWDMLTGEVPFRGTSAEVMYQHQHAPLPLKRLKEVPRNLRLLLKRMLEKDPVRRFQTPNELLNEVASIGRAIEARRNIKHEKLLGTLVLQPTTRRTKLPATKVLERSIAVLPFDSLSEEKGDTYFADGVQDEILSNLAKLS
jgi:serine/threonine protein kinase